MGRLQHKSLICLKLYEYTYLFMYLFYFQEELDETNSASSPSSSLSREPVRGHISSLRTSSTEQPKEIKTTLKDANQKHFDPRTGVVQQGPSEMGVAARTKSPSPYETASNMSTLNNDSLNGSMLTLGSRPDLLNSNLEIYDSAATDLNRLGELNGSLDQLSFQTLSNNNLALTANRLDPQLAATKNSIGVNTGHSLTPTKSILQSSKTNSTRATLFASTPALDNNNSLDWNVTPKGILQPNNNNNNNKSVTFMGLANSFQTLAPILMPTASANFNFNDSNTFNTNQFAYSQNQAQLQYTNSNHSNNNNNNNSNIKPPYYNSPVKDSAYSATETYHPDVYASSQSPSNGNLQNNTPSAMRQPNTISSTVRTQSSQQQRNYIAASPTSMKDTAYDRTVVNNVRRKLI